MVVPAFPVAKLAFLAIRQLSRPLANFLKNRATGSFFFRTYICMPPAQFLHWCETRLKMSQLGLGRPKSVTKLNEEQAVDSGATMLSEVFIYTTGSLTIYAEYRRQSRKDQAKEQLNLERMDNLVGTVAGLRQLAQAQEDELQQLEKLAEGRKRRS